MCSGLLGQKTCLCSEVILKLNPQKTTTGRWARRTSPWPHAKDRPLNRTRERDERLWDGRDQPRKDTVVQAGAGGPAAGKSPPDLLSPLRTRAGRAEPLDGLLHPARPHGNTALCLPGSGIEDPSLLPAP